MENAKCPRVESKPHGLEYPVTCSFFFFFTTSDLLLEIRQIQTRAQNSEKQRSSVQKFTCFQSYMNVPCSLLNSFHYLLYNAD